MRVLKIFKCEPCKIEVEKLVNSDDVVNCAECGSKCVKMISSARYLGNTTGRYPKIR